MLNKKKTSKIKVKIEGLDVSTVKGQQLAKEVAEVIKKYQDEEEKDSRKYNN